MNGTRTCSVPECQTPKKSLGLCEKHYYRLRRTGSTDDRPRRVPSVKQLVYRHPHTECIASECENLDCGSHGFCTKHYTRMLRHGTTEIKPKQMPRGADHSQWKGDHPTYSGAHMRLRAQMGNANRQVCACGARAKHWAYLHNDPNELASKNGAYSANLDCYEAMCVPCHKRFDLNRIAGEV